MSTKPLLDEQRSRLERRANVIRTRLLRTIETLDTRRHQVVEIGHHAKRLLVPVAVTVVGVAVLAVGATFGIRALGERRRERSLTYRFAKALAPLRREQRPPFWHEALRKVALAALGIVASEGVKRVAKAMTRPPPQLPGAAERVRVLSTPPPPVALLGEG